MQPDCSVSHRKDRMHTIIAIQFLKKLTTEQCKEFQWKLMFQLGCFYQVGASCTSCNFDRGAISTERRKKTWPTFECFSISKRTSICSSLHSQTHMRDKKAIHREDKRIRGWFNYSKIAQLNFTAAQVSAHVADYNLSLADLLPLSTATSARCNA